MLKVNFIITYYWTKGNFINLNLARIVTKYFIEIESFIITFSFILIAAYFIFIQKLLVIVEIEQVTSKIRKNYVKTLHKYI